MPKLNAAEYAEKWARRMKQSAPDMELGVQRVTQAPGALAAQKADKWAQNTAAARAKWSNRVRSVSLEDWRAATLAKGVNRVAQGVDTAQDKVAATAAKLLPHIQAGQDAVAKMPDLTLEDSISRVRAFITHMSKYNG